jgi:hypothetical protein
MGDLPKYIKPKSTKKNVIDETGPYASVVKRYRDRLKTLKIDIPWNTALQAGKVVLKEMLKAKEKQILKKRFEKREKSKKEKAIKDIKKKDRREKLREIQREKTVKKTTDLMKDLVTEANVGKVLKINGGRHYYTLTAENIIRIRRWIDDGFISFFGDAEATESDGVIFGEIMTTPIETVELIDPNEGLKGNIFKKQKPKKRGGFFPYHLNIDIDLSRYGIFKNNATANYTDNCLLIALRAGGLSEAKQESYKINFKQRYIDVKDLKDVAEKLQIKIVLHRPEETNKAYSVLRFGDSEEKYDIAMNKSHYFIYENSPMTRYSIENYTTVKNLNNWNFIVKKGERIRVDRSMTIDSYKMIKYLLKTDLFEPVEFDDDFINKFKEKSKEKIEKDIKFLDYNDDEVELYGSKDSHIPKTYSKLTDYHVIEKKDKNEKMDVYFFDTETYTLGTHETYLCCYVKQNMKGDNVKNLLDSVKSKKGSKSCYYMLDDITRTKNYGVVLYAHNMKYDASFIIRCLYNVKVLKVGSRILQIQGKFRNYGTKKEKNIIIKDTYAMVTKPLRDFGDCFGIKYDENEKGRKELISYKMYNDIKEGKTNEICYIDEAINKYNEYSNNKEQFIKNIDDWGLRVDNNKFDAFEYSKMYCKIDVIILMLGYNTFRNWIYNTKLTDDTICKLDIYYIISVASLADRYFKINDCFEDCYSLMGTPRVFIKNCVVGGRVMCGGNNKQRYKNVDISDYDAVSLYPSAINRLDGYLKGKPKVIPENSTYDDIKNYDGYYIKILIKKVGINRLFPLMSEIKEDGTRNFSNGMIGKELYVDKTTLEDLIEYQKIEFDIIRGYYFNDGFNNKCKETISYMFRERIKMKENKNPMQEVFKLIMNSAYGKTIMKEQDTEEIYHNSMETAERYMTNNSMKIIEGAKLSDRLYMVKRRVETTEHKNFCHIGCQVLSMSKRIMNEVITTAEDNGIKIYYQDTDSMHLKTKEIPKLEQLYNEKYNKVLRGKQMGQFHTDFDFHTENGKYKGNGRIYAEESVFLGKKCYIDKLRIEGDEEMKDKVDYHIRMKGVSNDSIKLKASQMGIEPIDLYNKLFDGEKIMFDLLCKVNDEAQKVNFKFKHFTYMTNDKFEREIHFNDNKKWRKSATVNLASVFEY